MTRCRGRRVRWAALSVPLVVLGLVLASLPPALAFQSSTVSLPPPATGAFAYNSFVPPLIPGTSYTDPVFGETVHRVTTDHSNDDLYARNMWWSADETRYLHRVCCADDHWDVIDVATGTVTHTHLPKGDYPADGGFDPVDPNALYYLVRDRGDGHGEIHRITLGPAGSWTSTVYFTAPAPLLNVEYLGGSINWLEAGGRYMLVRYGPAEPSVYVYDRQNLAAGPYANPIDATNYVESGSYLGLSPDGRFVVGYDSRPGVGVTGDGQGVSWAIDHANRTVAVSPTVFWSLCGDHGSFTSASDGRNYMVVFDCADVVELWRVDITNDAAGLTIAQQKVLPNNLRLLSPLTFDDAGHVATVARGGSQDWAFMSTEDSTDTFNSGTVDASGNITPWHVYRQEIVAVNILSGEVRRLTHHRSRSQDDSYFYQPRVSTSWGGRYVGFASNFNQPNSVDVYVVPFATPPSSSVSFAIKTPHDGATVKGSVEVLAVGASPSIAAVTFAVDGNAVGSTITKRPFAVRWDTRLVPNGTHTITARAFDAAGASLAVAASTVIVGNRPPEVRIVKPAAGATVKSTIDVVAAVHRHRNLASLQFQLDGSALGPVLLGPPFATKWDTTLTSNGSHTLRAVVTTLAGEVEMSDPVDVTVSNAPPTIVIVSPQPGDTVKGTVQVKATVTAADRITSVQFKLDGQNLGAAVTPRDYRVPWDTGTAAVGLHTLTAVATTTTGAQISSPPVTVNVVRKK